MTSFSQRLVLLLALSFLAGGCTLVEPGDPRDLDDRPAELRPLTSAEAQISEADNRFGLKFFRALSEAEPDTNLFISPLSVSMALGMTLNGADGETYAAMQETLELAGLSGEEINASYQSLAKLLTGLDPKVVFEIANSIWIREGFAVEAPFTNAGQTYFGAAVREMDFGSPAAVQAINDWADEQTRGRSTGLSTRSRRTSSCFSLTRSTSRGHGPTSLTRPRPATTPLRSTTARTSRCP